MSEQNFARPGGLVLGVDDEKSNLNLLSAIVGGIAPTTLSDRLKTLERHAVVERRFYSRHPPRAEYVLTQKGRDLGPVVRAMRHWGEKYGD